MNSFEILDECYSLSLYELVPLRDDLNELINKEIARKENGLVDMERSYYEEAKHSKYLEDTLVDRLEEIKELKKNG